MLVIQVLKGAHILVIQVLEGSYARYTSIRGAHMLVIQVLEGAHVLVIQVLECHEHMSPL
jgi:hypothetical protein